MHSYDLEIKGCSWQPASSNRWIAPSFNKLFYADGSIDLECPTMWQISWIYFLGENVISWETQLHKYKHGIYGCYVRPLLSYLGSKLNELLEIQSHRFLY